MTTTYPLSWPDGFPRAKHRENGRFKTNFDAALKNVQTSLRLFASDSGKKLESAVLSSNLDPNPLSTNRGFGNDPGVAVWFVWDGMQLCIPVDRYTLPSANLQAIHHIIEARRVELRHGTLALVRATFQGFKALPAPSHWAKILEIPHTATVADIETAYRRLAQKHHPDLGGSDAMMSELNTARDRALRERA